MQENLRYPVLLFGEVLFDQFPDRTVLGGAPFNVARHLAGFGQPPLLISRVGRDSGRTKVMRAMKRYNMDNRCIQIDPLHPTGSVIVEMGEDGHKFDIVDNQAYDHIHLGLARLGALAARPQVVYYGTLASRHNVSYRALMGVLRLSPGLRYLDLNLRAPWFERARVEGLMHQAHALKISIEEYEILRRWLKLRADLKAGCHQILTRFNLRLLLLTRGENGVMAATPEGECLVQGGKPVGQPVVDYVGAGDAFSSVAIVGLLKDWPLPLILERADQFARAILGIRGAVPDKPDIYMEMLESWGAIHGG